MTLVTDLTAQLGSDISAFLDYTGISTSGGNVTGWIEARASAVTLLPLGSGNIAYTAGVGLTFDAATYLRADADLLGTSKDNWAMISVLSPNIIAASNPIAMAAGTAGSGIAMKLSPAGALFESVSEVTMSSGALAAAMQVLTLQRVSGTMNLRINGVDTGVGASGTTPGSVTGSVYVGWEGIDHDKFNGLMRAAIYVPTHPGSTALGNAEAILMSAYVTAATAAPARFVRYQTSPRRHGR